VLGIIAAGFLVLAVHLHVGNVWDPWEPWDVQRVVLSLAMMGAALGFLPYNRNPATIFMGDAGSMLLGFNTAVVLLLFAKSHATCWMLGAIMVFALPLMDMTLAIARRWRNFKPLMIGDRSHFYDQLIDRGLPVKKVVAISYLLAAFFALVGCAPIFLRTRYVIPLYFLVVLIVLLVIMKFDMLRADQPRDGSPPQ
jgi:UDP-GlcNAc:undecaprenyl-phosphate GlcNAc-1-phosphate transferase